MKRIHRRVPSLRKKLILPMLLTALIPMTIFAWMTNRAINSSNMAAGRAKTDELSQTIAKEIYSLESNAMVAAQTLTNSPLLRNTYRSLFEGVSASDELDYYKLLRETVATSALLDEFYGIRVYLPDTALLTREEYNFYSLAELNAAELPREMNDSSRTRMGWTDWLVQDSRNKHSSVLYKSYWIQCVLRGKNGGDLYIAVDIAMSTIQKIMLNHNEIACAYILYGVNGETLVQCGEEAQGSEQQTYRVEKLLNDGTLLCIEVDLTQFRSDNIGYLSRLFYIALACAILIPLSVVLIFNRQCREMAKLADANVRMAQGEYQRIPEDATTREVLTIQQTHNNMVMRIDDLIHNVYEEKIEKQEAQLNSLFEQIKPHFLYNTLESGKWMAIRAEDTRTAKFLEKLAKYFKVGLGKGMEQVPLRSELEHIRLYIELINMRIANCVTLDVDVDEEILDCMVIRLLLQPLVENAVEHGICARPNPHGTVRITGNRQEHALYIRVENDGVNMPEEQLEKLNRGEETGLGIANVRKRLELFYGDACEISFENRSEGGVRSIIKLERY